MGGVRGVGGEYVLQGYLEGTTDVVIRVLSAEIHNFQRSPHPLPFLKILSLLLSVFVRVCVCVCVCV